MLLVVHLLLAIYTDLLNMYNILHVVSYQFSFKLLCCSYKLYVSSSQLSKPNMLSVLSKVIVNKDLQKTNFLCCILFNCSKSFNNKNTTAIH